MRALLLLLILCVCASVACVTYVRSFALYIATHSLTLPSLCSESGESDEDYAQKMSWLALPIGELVGGGLRDGVAATITDFTQDLQLSLTIVHRDAASFDELKNPHRFELVNDADAAAATLASAAGAASSGSAGTTAGGAGAASEAPCGDAVGAKRPPHEEATAGGAGDAGTAGRAEAEAPAPAKRLRREERDGDEPDAPPTAAASSVYSDVILLDEPFRGV